MLSYNDLKPGVTFIKDGQPYKVLEYNFVRMQQRKPVAQLKIKNLISGKVINYTAQQNESFEEAEIEKAPAEFIYSRRGEYWFRNSENPSDRFFINETILGDAKNFLKEKTVVNIVKFKNKPIAVEVPIKVDLKVIEAPPGIRGNTAEGGTKTVTTETGFKVSVPLFIEEGDIIRINTENGEYVERVKKD